MSDSRRPEGTHVDSSLRRRAESVWREVTRASVRSPSPLLRRFLGKNPGKYLSRHLHEPWHQAILYALTGQRESLILVMRGASLLVASMFPNVNRHILESAQVYRWCSLRLGLLGWAQVWDVAMSGHVLNPGANSFSAKGMEKYLNPECDGRYAFEYGDPREVRGPLAGTRDEAAQLNQILRILETLIISLEDLSINDICVSRDRIHELIDFYVSEIVAWTGCPVGEVVSDPDFTVDLPEEFQGFGPNFVG